MVLEKLLHSSNGKIVNNNKTRCETVIAFQIINQDCMILDLIVTLRLPLKTSGIVYVPCTVS